MIAKPKKLNKTQLKKRADTLASLYYRSVTPYCELKGLDAIHCGGPLQWAHIYSRSVLHMRYEPYNNLVLCAGHHSYYTHQPIEWTRVLENHYPERLSLAELNRHKYAKIDYQYWIARFSQSQTPANSAPDMMAA